MGGPNQYESPTGGRNLLAGRVVALLGRFTARAEGQRQAAGPNSKPTTARNAPLGFVVAVSSLNLLQLANAFHISPSTPQLVRN
jgi:hypothetical protein